MTGQDGEEMVHGSTGRPVWKTELGRIRSSAVLAFLLLVCAAVLDGPVTILGWMLLGAGILCLLYVVLASTVFMKKTQSQLLLDESNDQR